MFHEPDLQSTSHGIALAILSCLPLAIHSLWRPHHILLSHLPPMTATLRCSWAIVSYITRLWVPCRHQTEKLTVGWSTALNYWRYTSEDGFDLTRDGPDSDSFTLNTTTAKVKLSKSKTAVIIVDMQ